MKILSVTALAAAIALPLGFAAAGPMRGHPHLLKAQEAINAAYRQITDSQTINEFDAGGHAKNAKEALTTAKEEIRLAAESENKNAR